MCSCLCTRWLRGVHLQMTTPLARFLLDQGPRSEALDGFALAALLLDVDIEVIQAAARGYASRRLRLPARLMTHLVAHVPRHLKLPLACSAVASRLAPRAFTPLFKSAFRRA